MMLAAYFDQYPAHLAAAARRQAATVGHHHHPPDPSGHAPCPLHPHGSPGDSPFGGPLLSYPAMASVPEEDRSEGGRTYTVSSNSEQQEEGDVSNEASVNGDHKPGDGDALHCKSPLSSPTSDSGSVPHKKASQATTDSYHTARGKSPSELHYSGRDSSERSLERSSPSRDRVYDPTLNSFIPRDHECPVHSPKTGGSLRSSPVRTSPTTPTRESPTRPLSFSRNSPTRMTPPRTSPLRSSSRTSSNRVASPRMSPSSPQPRNSPFRVDSSRNSIDGNMSPVRMDGSRTSIDGHSSPVRSPYTWPDAARNSIEGQSSPVRSSPVRSASIGSPQVARSPTSTAPSTRRSAADSELLHCTICSQQFENPKVLPCLHTFCERCLLSTTPAESLTISCPECRQQSILPQAGVTDLQSNSWVQGVIDSLEAVPSPDTEASAPSCAHCTNTAAVSRCVQCQTELCEPCVQVHTDESEHEGYEALAVAPSGGSPGAAAAGGGNESPMAESGGGSAMAATEGAHSFQDDTKLHCPSHEGMTLRFFCQDCDTAVCITCTDIEHRMHDTTRLTDAMQHHTTAMHSLVDAVANKLPAVTCCIEDLTEAVEQLAERRKEAEDRIRATFAGLKEALDQREAQLLAGLKAKARDKQDMLEAQRGELQAWVSGMESGSELLKKAIQDTKAPMELVLLKKQFGDRLKEHVNADLPPGPRENTLLSFEPNHMDAAVTALRRVGSVVTNPAVPYTTIASGDNLKQVPVGRRGHITVITRDFKGERVGIGGAELTAVFSSKSFPANTPSPPVSPCSYSSKSSYPNLHPQSTSSTPHSITANTSRAPSEKSSSPQPVLNGHHQQGASNGHHPSVRRQSTGDDADHSSSVKVIDHNNGAYDVEFFLYRPGKYTLDLNLYGMPIDQSPFTVTAVPMGSSCSIHGSDHSTDSPYAPARPRHSAKLSTLSNRTPKSSRNTPSQRSSGSRITLPIEDDLIMKVGAKGRNKGEFVNPQGICYSGLRGGRIVVTDSISQCVQVFSSDGEFKTRFGTRGRNVGQLQRPTGVATLPNGNYAVADYENKCVSIFEPNGKYVYRIGQGKLLGPKGVSADRHGNIIVVDNKGSCVCIFQSNGRLLSRFGNRGTNYLQFAGPHFVAVNSQDHIVTTDFHNHCVKVFDSEGEFLYTFGNHGEGNGQFNAPTGVAVDDNDNIIVADWGNCRIQVFDSRGSFLSFVNTLADPLHGPQGLAFTDDGHVVVADSGNHCFKVYKYLQ